MKGVHDALTRLSGVKKVTVWVQEGIIVATTDSTQGVHPVAIWNEIIRVGFIPVEMEIRARGILEEGAYVVDGRRWPLVRPALADGVPRSARLRVREGAEDPPRVEVLE